MNLKRKNLGIDSDGVLLNFDTGFRKVGSEVLGKPLVCLQPRVYSLGPRYGISGKEVGMIIEAMEQHPDGWGNLEDLAGARDAMVALRNEGARLIIVTSIDERLVDLRAANLERCNIPFDDIIAVGANHGCKQKALSDINAYAFFDDSLDHVIKAEHVPHRFWIDIDIDHPGCLSEDVGYARSLSSAVKQLGPSHGFQFDPVAIATAPTRKRRSP